MCTYEGRVVATDPAGKGASIVLTIEVEDDADEPPAITQINSERC